MAIQSPQSTPSGSPASQEPPLADHAAIATAPQPSADAQQPFEFEVPPMIRRSQEAFRRDLPRLLDKRYGHWVAYHGDERIGFGRSQFELYDECTRRGLRDDEFVVRVVAPEAPTEIDMEQLQDV